MIHNTTPSQQEASQEAQQEIDKKELDGTQYTSLSSIVPSIKGSHTENQSDLSVSEEISETNLKITYYGRSLCLDLVMRKRKFYITSF